MGESCGSEIGEHVQAANAHPFLVSTDQDQVIRDGSSREKAVGWVAVIWQEIRHLVSNFISKSDLDYTGVLGASKQPVRKILVDGINIETFPCCLKRPCRGLRLEVYGSSSPSESSTGLLVGGLFGSIAVRPDCFKA